MRRVIPMFIVFLFSVLGAIAQQKTVSGVVKDANGLPVPFATITETGTKRASNADANGVFSLKVSPSASLTVSAAGFATKTVSSEANQTVTLVGNANELKEVVVTTAFGIKKSARVTPYSAQVIDNEQLRIIPQTNVNSAMAGKVAGAQFRGQSAVKLSSQGSFRIRGGQSLGGDVEPIFVVDGTIVNSFDVNPDDIADLTVLKGANATALFGGRAVNGAVVINTKKGGQAGTSGIELNQGITFDKVYIIPKNQNIYAGGTDNVLNRFVYDPATMPEGQAALDGKYFHDYTDDASWGPRMVGQEYIPWYAWTPGHSRSYQTALLTPQKDNTRDFWETGITNVTSLSFSKAGQGYSTRLSYTNNSVKGLLPTTKSQKNILSATMSADLSSHFTAGTNITYTSQKIDGVFDDGYANQSAGSFSQWFHRDLDMGIMKELRGLKTPIGTYASWNLRSNPDAGNTNIYKGNYWYNFYSYFDLIDYQTKRDRVYGDVFLTYKLNNNFNIKATVRKNQLNTGYENITPSELEISAGQTGILGEYSTGSTRYNEMNYELLASFNKTVGKLAINTSAGANWLRTSYQDNTFSTFKGLNVPGLYSIANSKANPIIGNRREQEQQRSGFAVGDFEWNRFASVSWAIRKDYYSTLSLQNGNSLVSPSVGAGFVFSEFTKNSIPWLSFGKVFGSWGKKPLPLKIYDNNFLYSVNQFQWDYLGAGNFLMSTPNKLVDPSVVGALITTYEGGVDLKFLGNRLGINATYYDETIDKAPVEILTDPVSGFNSKIVNAAKINRKGIELIVSASPLVGKEFNWDITTTFSKLISNKVLELAGQDRLVLAGGAFGTRYARAFLQKDYNWGQLIGGGILRTADGTPIVNPANGEYLPDIDKQWGSVVPTINGGLTNTLTYKNFVFNFSMDYQVGGKFFSLSESWGHYSGILEATAAVNDKGMNVRDAVADGGGVHVVGVSSVDNTKTVDMYVAGFDYWHQFYNNRIAEPFVHSLTYVKLRELSMGYQIPVKRLKVNGVVKGAVLSVVARNPWMIYRETDNFDPSEISAVQGEDGQLPGTRSIGFNLKLNF